MQRFDALIVGAGHAGAQAAIGLRQAGFTGSIGMAGTEPELPYERPPLSKDYLAGLRPFERMLIRPAAFWAEREVRMLPGRSVTAIDPAARTATLAGGETLGWGALVWAAGGEARRLSCAGAELGGVHCVRSRADVDAMIAALPRVRRVVVVGGGYIGLEAAAVLVKLGREVTVLEAQDRVLARVAGEPLSRFYEAEHRARGVTIHLGCAVDCIEGEGGQVTAVCLADGTRLPADMVVVGVGIVPSVAPLIDAGAEGGNGVSVDEYCRTSLPGVYAVGDCAAHVNRFAGGARVRIESVQNANDMAVTAARHIAGHAQPYDAVPWFWSDQYDLKLQTVGLSGGHDAAVLRGDPAGRSFTLAYLRAGRLVALDCVNLVKDYAQGRALVAAGVSPEPALLANASVPLKAHLTAAAEAA